MAGATFIDRFITQVQLIGAAEFSKRLLGIGTAHSAMADRIKRAEADVARAVERTARTRTQIASNRQDIRKGIASVRDAKREFEKAESYRKTVGQTVMNERQEAEFRTQARDAAEKRVQIARDAVKAAQQKQPPSADVLAAAGRVVSTQQKVMEERQLHDLFSEEKEKAAKRVQVAAEAVKQAQAAKAAGAATPQVVAKRNQLVATQQRFMEAQQVHARKMWEVDALAGEHRENSENLKRIRENFKLGQEAIKNGDVAKGQKLIDDAVAEKRPAEIMHLRSGRFLSQYKGQAEITAAQLANAESGLAAAKNAHKAALAGQGAAHDANITAAKQAETQATNALKAANEQLAKSAQLVTSAENGLAAARNAHKSAVQNQKAGQTAGVDAARLAEAKAVQDLTAANNALKQSTDRVKSAEAGLAAANSSEKEKLDALTNSQRELNKVLGVRGRLMATLNRHMGRKESAEENLGRLQNLDQTLKATVGRVFTTAVAVAAASMFWDLTKAILQTGMAFQKMRVQLAFLYRDFETGGHKGADAFKWAQDFATKSPFTLESTTQALRDMLVFGLNPTTEKMQLLGGMADLFGRDFSDAVKAVGFGLQGNFSRLRRGFAISREEVQKFASVQLFDGKKQVKNVKIMEDALFNLFRHKYGGYMKMMENTTFISVQNVSDAWRNMLGRIGMTQMGGLKETLDSITAVLKGVDDIKIQAMSISIMKIANVLISVASTFSAIVGVVIGAVGAAISHFGYLIENMGKGAHLRGLREMGKDLRESGSDAGKPFADAANWGTDRYIENMKRINEQEKALAEMKKTIQPKVGKEPPTAPGGVNAAGNSAVSGAASQFVREVIAGADIAKIGIRATELPDVKSREQNNQMTMRLETGEGSGVRHAILDILNEAFRTMNRHGVMPPVKAY